MASLGWSLPPLYRYTAWEDREWNQLTCMLVVLWVEKRKQGRSGQNHQVHRALGFEMFLKREREQRWSLGVLEVSLGRWRRIDIHIHGWLFPPSQSPGEQGLKRDSYWITGVSFLTKHSHRTRKRLEMEVGGVGLDMGEANKVLRAQNRKSYSSQVMQVPLRVREWVRLYICWHHNINHHQPPLVNLAPIHISLYHT